MKKIAVAAGAAAWSLLVQGQTLPAQLPPSIDPGALQRQSIERQRQMQEEEEQRARASGQGSASPLGVEAAKPKAPQTGVPSARFLLRALEYSPSELLSEADLKALGADYLGRQIGFSDLQALITRINARYKELGAYVAEATLPAQDVTDGVVQIRLIEGHIGAYHLKGNATTDILYVLPRMHNAPGALVDIARIEQDIVRFNRSNDVQLQAELKPGQAFGTSDLDLVMQEPALQSVTLFTDNAGSHSTGEERLGVVYTNHSLTGYRDELMLSSTAANGYEGRALGYGVPVNTWGGRLTISMNDDHTQVRYGPFASLNVTGFAKSWGLALRQPLVLEAATSLYANLGYVARHAESYIEPVQIQRVDTQDTNLGLEGVRSDALGYWSGTVNVVSGNTRSPAQEDYVLARGNVQRNQVLGGAYSMQANLVWQSALCSNLPNGEQFFLGGTGTVRGYSNAAYSGLQGYALSVEVHRALDNSAAEPRISVFGFVDGGETRPKGPGLQAINLQSLGLGAELRLDAHLFGRVTFAHQSIARAEEPTANRIDGYLSWTF